MILPQPTPLTEAPSNHFSTDNFLSKALQELVLDTTSMHM